MNEYSFIVTSADKRMQTVLLFLKNELCKKAIIEFMRRLFPTLLALLGLLVTSNHLCFAQTDPVTPSPAKRAKITKVEKVRKQVAKIGVGGKITVIRVDDQDFYGKVSAIGPDSFQIVEVDLKQTLVFEYADVRKIKTGDGQKNLITGKRKNPKKGWLYGVAIFGALLTVLGIAMSDKDF